MKKLIFLFLALCFLSAVNAQEEDLGKNTFFLELLGNGGVFSINYERSIHQNLYGRVGFGQWSSNFWGSEAKVTTFPVLITYVTGRKKNHFEVGGGLLLGTEKESDALGAREQTNTIIDLTSFVGYRYQAPGRGILFRVGFTPFLSLDNKAEYPDEGFMVSGGVSIGYHF